MIVFLFIKRRIKVANLNPKAVHLKTNKNIIKDLFDNFGYKGIPIINNNEQIFWQKYCSITPGSGHNNLHFIKDDVVINKISVIKWIENNEKQIN